MNYKQHINLSCYGSISQAFLMLFTDWWYVLRFWDAKYFGTSGLFQKDDFDFYPRR